MDDIVQRYLTNGGVYLTMALAGVVYGHLLWSLSIRPNVVLYVVAVVPGAMFLITIWTIRAVQGTPSVLWFLLLLDWLIFAHTGYFSILAASWWRRRP